MKKIITILITIISLTSFSQETEKYNFEVEITAFRNFEGSVLVHIFDKNKEVVQTQKVAFKNEKCVFEVKDLPKGTYAIRFFHDENNNNELDFKWGIAPEEGYGYSNNATGMFGEPDFKEWLFLLDENKSLHLKVNYLF